MGAVPQGVSLLANRNSERHQPRRRLKVRLADVGSSPSAAINPMPTINKSRPNHNNVVHAACNAAATKINCTSPRCLASALCINAANLWCHVNGGSKIYVRVLQRQYKIEHEGSCGARGHVAIASVDGSGSGDLPSPSGGGGGRSCRPCRPSSLLLAPLILMSDTQRLSLRY